MYRRKRLGVFVSHIYGDYQRMLCTGITRKAREYGYQIEIFTSNDGEDVGDYGLGEYSILRIPDPARYDGILLASGTYRLAKMAEAITNLLQTQFHCPVIAIEHHESPFPRVTLENNSTVKDLVLHLAKVHGYTRLAYLGNESRIGFDDLRRDFFLEEMRELSLSAEGCIFSCDGTREGISSALSDILKREPRPQAIVCYNDAIAINVIRILYEQGIHVPGDIAVTGFDTLEFGQKTSPVLTSVTFPIHILGERAVELMAETLKGEPVPPVTQVYASVSVGSSCGCSVTPLPDSYAYTHILSDVIANREANLIQEMHMAANLQGVDDLDTGMDLIADFVKILPHCRQFYLCLYHDWDRMPSHLLELFPEEETYDSDTVLLKLALKDGRRLPECTFPRHSTLPDYLYEEDSAFLYTPLFFGEQHFGYLALSFDQDTVGYDFAFNSWLFNVNNMLKSLCDKKNMGILTGRLETLYTKDELTGLLNRQGFKHYGNPLFERAVSRQEAICVIQFDLDNLQQINDIYGYTEGDFALQVLARALENSVNETCLCTRHGGDEFQILAPGCEAGSASQILAKVQKYLDNYNRLHARGYLVQASGGYCVRVPRAVSELSDMLREADQAMYRMKQEHKKASLFK